MKLRVLVDNHTYIDQYYLGEPGLSFYIETEGRRYLLDTGYSDVLCQNAAAMAIDIQQLDGIVLSHGHNDHTRGLAGLLSLYPTAGRKPELLTHPQAFWQRQDDGLDVGMPFTEEGLRQHFQIRKSAESVWLTQRLVYLGEIERQNDFEGQAPIGQIKDPAGSWQPDFVRDDSALAYCTAQGLVILTGCSHAGICNIIAQAKRICGETRIAAIVGGFHLLAADADVLRLTQRYLEQQAPQAVYACHCTDLAAQIALSQGLPVHEVGVGLALDWPD